MEISKKTEDKALTVSVKGRLDTTTAPSLEAALESVCNDFDSLVLDFKELEYISSAGLRVVLKAKKSMGSKVFKIKNVSTSVKEIFDITGFSSILDIE